MFNHSTDTFREIRYFVIHNLAKDETEIIRFAALLRGTESAWQAVSYGLTSLTIFAEAGGVYFNFALWGLSILPAWHIVKHFGMQTHHPDNSEGSEARRSLDKTLELDEGEGQLKNA